MRKASVLLTGATGLLGGSYLYQFLTCHDAGQIVALVRRGRKTPDLDALGVRTIGIDLCAPDLGLKSDLYENLTAETTSVVHCAADIRFNIVLEESRRVNVIGTENLLRFAARCPRLEKFAHMSTVYVSGGRPGHIPEEAADPGEFFNPYQQTKFEAEHKVFEAMRSIPASIYRFSTMIYNRELRRVAQFNYFHQLLRLASVNPLRTIPALRQAKIDLIPSDWAASVFDYLFEQRWRPGEVIHICAGPDHSLTVGELFNLTFDCFSMPGKRPEIVSLEEFDKMASTILTTPSRKKMWQSLGSFVPHMNVDQTFGREKLTDAARARDDLRLPDTRRMFVDVLSYCMATNWGMSHPEIIAAN